MLIVIAIISILASIVLVALGGGREKAKIVSFKQQTNSLKAAVINLCDSYALPNASAIITKLNGGALPNGITFTDTDIVSASCGPTGTQVFQIAIHSTNLTTPCTGTIQQSGASGWSGC